MDLKGKKVLIIGTGISGMGAAQLLYRIGAVPVLYDENKNLKAEEVRARLPEGVEAEIYTGILPEHIREEAVLVVPSPGVSTEAEWITAFRKQGIPVWGELEMGYRYAAGQLAAITGTNGKTTTTTLVGEILKDYYPEVYVVGNIGTPFTESALSFTEQAAAVAEVSSFQLETIESFRPAVSAVLNMTPDHLDRHHSMENYVAVKERIFENQTQEDVCVLNYEDAYTRAMGEKCRAKVVYFSSMRKLDQGLYLDGEEIWLAEEGRRERLMNIHEMHLVGRCNVENVMAAIAVSGAMSVPMDRILKVVKEFRAVEHRIEFVASVDGVDYYNDSKATNPDAAIQGILAMARPTILIAGGYDKGNEYDSWIETFGDKVKYLVLIGQTADQIEDCARAHGIDQIYRAESFEEALCFCSKTAVCGDAVLLSPACASWGMFPNYEVRGRQFKEYVYALQKKKEEGAEQA